jgi:hypothetical protein
VPERVGREVERGIEQQAVGDDGGAGRGCSNRWGGGQAGRGGEWVRRGPRRDAALSQLCAHRIRLCRQRVDAQRALGRLVDDGEQRARLGGAARLSVVERGEQARALARSAPQHRVDELEARAAGRLRQLDALVDRRVWCDAVEEQQLQHAEPQRVAHRRVEPLDGPAGAGGDHVVERAAALDHAVRKARRERALARIEAGARRLRRERAIGVGAVLLDAPQHGRGDAAGGRDGGGGG